MLNISNTKGRSNIDLLSYKSGQFAYYKKHYKHFNRFLMVFALIGIITLFMPWTQNIKSNGIVTTLRPNQRPQTIQSQIPGRVEEWFVQEGDYVEKGDTILRISEIKIDYFDDRLIERTNDQITAKSSSVDAYKSKIEALNRQIVALQQEQKLKMKQAKNKLLQSYLKAKSDSIDFEAAKINAEISKRQYDRTVVLAEDGLKAIRDVEEKNLKLQESNAKLIAQENKLLTSLNNIINAQVDVSQIENTYVDKISKAQSALYTAKSSHYDTQVQVSKLENSYTNYQKRNDLLFITSPQNGYINKAIIGGIGETFKEGQELLGIMPASYELAVETFVKPNDLPLLHVGEKVRVQFEGWPAIVFSGWPNQSYGTYGARVVAIQNFISPNGKYRVLLAPDSDDHTWPDAIRIGSGARTFALLEDVPIWYELWRQINSFPPNYYQPTQMEGKEKSEK
ncbi:HlyD family efflux transporter periplasmic adaptor subunit [Flavicella sp.]|uniref:HlyD family secretion protein n=1 Tax=Flavicella sp. TaxID=2957742 RepID=UPI0026294898|nr:HlyD family efflux transporter periplasmic adaptor subunit [Flavicella sp.]MDG1804953.1 HlyD family efflux transporter periplasmic adaptor subunit [Flavicella sp.]MDG2279078.1 HlyD family efflux transporter periplasmic adaptor subunit [Flavicella sp.]